MDTGQYITRNNATRIKSENVFDDNDNIGFSRSEIKDCIEVLENHGYLNVVKQGGIGDSYRCRYKVTPFGFDNYARAYIDDYSTIMDRIVSAIVNEDINNNNDLVSKVGESLIIVNHILDVLELNDHVKLIKTASDMVLITHIAASLRRSLAQCLQQYIVFEYLLHPQFTWSTALAVSKEGWLPPDFARIKSSWQ